MQSLRLLLVIMTVLLGLSCSTPLEKKTVKNVEMCATLACRNLTWTDKFKHCGTFIHECGNYSEASITNQYSLQGFAFQYDPENSGSSTYIADREAFLNPSKEDVTHQLIAPPAGMTSNEFIERIRTNAKTYTALAYWPYGPNSNSAADFPLYKSGAKTKKIDGALGLHHYHKDSELDEVKNNAIRLFYEYASSKTKEIAKQIKKHTINNGSFKNLTIGDSKTSVIKSLQSLQAFYVSTKNSTENGIIDLRSNKTTDFQKRLLNTDRWNVTYDEQGKIFWFLQLDFKQDSLSEINVKSSGIELP